MEWKSIYEKWLRYETLETELKEQLMKTECLTELEDSFYKYLEFGTGGMRGIIGPGINRMNIYTIRRVAAGLASYIGQYGEEAKTRGVVIAYDSRRKSNVFAMEAAKTLGHEGIQVYLFNSLRTTPELSFAVRYLHAYSGIVITASHNPAIYNGLKVYGQDGAQFASEDADIIVEHVNKIKDELAIPVRKKEELKETGLLKIIGNNVDLAYQKQLQNLVINGKIIDQVRDTFKIVYTPLHGAGNIPVRKGLQAIGFNQVKVVKEQALPDGSFPTVTYPNPEDPAAFSLAMQYGEKLNADLLLATDPDADRVGVGIKHDGEYTLLTGNQIGALLLHYLITQKKERKTLPNNAAVLKTIVTSELGRDIATAYGIKTIDTLTGFKYISEKIKEFEEQKNHSFFFGYEESYGYLFGDFVRDKDAVQTCLLIADAAAYYHTKEMTLYDALQNIYETYGYYIEDQESLTLEGKKGVEKIALIMQGFRENPPIEFVGKKVIVREDYAKSKAVFVKEDRIENISLPEANVLKYKLEDGGWVCVRPSGTEPKIKFYFGVKENTQEKSVELLEGLKSEVMELVR